MSASLPPLFLGIPRPTITSTEAQLVAELQSLNRPYADVSFAKSGLQKSSLGSLRIGKLLMSEGHTDALIWKTSPRFQPSFLVPVLGSGKIIERRQSVQWAGPHQILQFTYAHPLEIHAAEAHMVGIVPDFEDLKQAIAALRPMPEDIVEQLTSAATEVHSGIFNGVDYHYQIRQLLAIVATAQGDQAFLERIGIDEILHKLLAEMLVAKQAHQPDAMPPPAPKRSERAVDIICDHIRNNIGSPLTIPAMERLAGLTGRAIGYAFQSRFNCSPQEWQRNFLLDEARRRLARAEQCPSVKSVAYELGFSSPSSFSSHYRRRFGELPTNTAMNASSRAPAPSHRKEVQLVDDE